MKHEEEENQLFEGFNMGEEDLMKNQPNYAVYEPTIPSIIEKRGYTGFS